MVWDFFSSLPWFTTLNSAYPCSPSHTYMTQPRPLPHYDRNDDPFSSQYSPSIPSEPSSAWSVHISVSIPTSTWGITRMTIDFHRKSLVFLLVSAAASQMFDSQKSWTFSAFQNYVSLCPASTSKAASAFLAHRATPHFCRNSLVLIRLWCEGKYLALSSL